MQEFVILLILGLLFALVIIWGLRITGMERDAASSPIMLIAIALFYPVFAAENGDVHTFIIHALIAIAFTILAIFGYKKALVIVGIGLISHGIFDLAAGFLTNSPAPNWWAPICLGADIVLGGWLIIFRPWEKA